MIAAGGELAAQSIHGKEFFGARLGGDYSPGYIDPTFGRGSVLEVHFLYGLGPWFGVETALSSNDFGPSSDVDKNISFTGSDREIDLQIYSFTIGMLATKAVYPRLSTTIEAGPGLYSINAVLPQGYFEYQRNEFRLGLYGGVGVVTRITRSFSIDLSGKWHYIFAGNDEWDTIPFFTGKNRAQYYEISIGILMNTGS